ncbi:MAG: hypothetical protein SRB2_01300 [Desulfobacteraceae bacterium Eth-SRB2]|nr:MAG: hypothetical protein SRB2_01300 [Desulfobacteraceae bacterium Eth-SRB2]
MSREKTPLHEKNGKFFLDIYTQQRDMVFALIRTRYFGLTRREIGQLTVCKKLAAIPMEHDAASLSRHSFSAKADR